eukprot:2095259-Pyramimonas_sp.AAC.1
MLQEVNPAGAPAAGSDGSWTQAQSADVSGVTSSDPATNDGLMVNDPWRTQAQQLPTPARHPAVFAP